MLVQLALKRASFPIVTTSTMLPTPTVYLQPSQTPTATPMPTAIPTNTSTGVPLPVINNPSPTQFIPSATPVPTAVPTTTPTSSDHMTYIMNGINTYRESLGLSDVKTSTQTCNFAATRAHEITTNFSHDGFNQRIANKTIPYTSWTKITENLAMTSDYTQVVTLWKNSAGHAANMREDTPYVCVRGEGNYFAYEGMKP